MASYVVSPDTLEQTDFWDADKTIYDLPDADFRLICKQSEVMYLEDAFNFLGVSYRQADKDDLPKQNENCWAVINVNAGVGSIIRGALHIGEDHLTQVFLPHLLKASFVATRNVRQLDERMKVIEQNDLIPLATCQHYNDMFTHFHVLVPKPTVGYSPSELSVILMRTGLFSEVCPLNPGLSK